MCRRKVAVYIAQPTNQTRHACKHAKKHAPLWIRNYLRRWEEERMKQGAHSLHTLYSLVAFPELLAYPYRFPLSLHIYLTELIGVIHFNGVFGVTFYNREQNHIAINWSELLTICLLTRLYAFVVIIHTPRTCHDIWLYIPKIWCNQLISYFIGCYGYIQKKSFQID